MRVKPLKQPKYLLGGIAGAAYSYFFFSRCAFAVQPIVAGIVGARAGCMPIRLDPTRLNS